MLLPSRYPVKQTPRVDFRPEWFRKLVATHGLNVTWEQANECPCRRPTAGLGLTLDLDAGTSNQPRLDCPSCAGRGYLYHSSQVIKAAITGSSHHPDRFRVYGEAAKNMVSISTLPEHRLNLGDRFTLNDSVMLYREQHTYDESDPTSTRYPIKVQSLDLEDGAEVRGVMHLAVADADGVTQVGAELVEGTDFDVDVNGRIAWINPPDNGRQWSISYYGCPVYVVTDLPHPYRDTITAFKLPAPAFQSLPVNAMATLEFLASGVPTAAVET